MTIIFRTDASQQIGSGHVMRCLTLADILKKRGTDVIFICREHSGNLIWQIEAKDYAVLRLPQADIEYTAAPEDLAHAPWLGVSWEQDAVDTIAILGDIRPQWLIVDSYAIDRRWEQMLRPHVERIMVIDDLSDRPHDCDVLLDQNLYQAMEMRYEKLVPKSCHNLLGPRYALLRTEFASARKDLRQRDGHVRRILVFFGGVDPTNETEKTLQALAEISDRQFEVDVVVGIGNFHKEQIRNICAVHEGFHFHCQVANMAELMAAADLAIGAGGTATWERCAMGTPAILTVVADNQKELAEAGARKGLFFYMGESHSVSSEKLLNVLKFSLCVPETLQYYSVNCLTFVDAKGGGRVANILFPPQIIIRQASLADCDSVYEWRNAEETRRYIFNAEPISVEIHRSWYCNSLKNPNRILLIGEIDNKPVGVLRYDFSGDEALISIYLVPGVQGAGVGSQLLRCGSQWVRENSRYIKVIKAEIFRDNIASIRAFESAGYKEHHLIFQEAL